MKFSQASLFFLIFVFYACKNEAPDVVIADTKQASQRNQYYQEPGRSWVHFTAENGTVFQNKDLVFFGDTYHLFYAYNPNKDANSPNQIGHAVSTDLLNWVHKKPITQGLQGAVKDFSIVVNDDTKTLLAIFRGDADNLYTAKSTDAYSWDTSNKLSLDNENLESLNGFKVHRHVKSKLWALTLCYDDQIHFLTSDDFSKWTFKSSFSPEINGKLSSPNLYTAYEQKSGEPKDILLLSTSSDSPNGGYGTLYFTGKFEDGVFSPEHKDPKWLDHGTSLYGLQTFNSKSKSSRYAMGSIASINHKASTSQAWEGVLSAPRELELYDTKSGFRLKTRLLSAYAKNRGSYSRVSRKSNLIPTNFYKNIEEYADGAFEILIDISNVEGPKFSFDFIGSNGDTLIVRFDIDQNEIVVDRSKLEILSTVPTVAKTEISSFSKIKNIAILVDRSSIEIFADNGFAVQTYDMRLENGLQSLMLNGAAGVKATVYELKNAIPTPQSVTEVLDAH